MPRKAPQYVEVAPDALEEIQGGLSHAPYQSFVFHPLTHPGTGEYGGSFRPEFGQDDPATHETAAHIQPPTTVTPPPAISTAPPVIPTAPSNADADWLHSHGPVINVNRAPEVSQPIINAASASILPPQTTVNNAPAATAPVQQQLPAQDPSLDLSAAEFNSALNTGMQLAAMSGPPPVMPGYDPALADMSMMGMLDYGPDFYSIA